jgi:hypothetical protein
MSSTIGRQAILDDIVAHFIALGRDHLVEKAHGEIVFSGFSRKRAVRQEADVVDILGLEHPVLEKRLALRAHVLVLALHGSSGDLHNARTARTRIRGCALAVPHDAANVAIQVAAGLQHKLWMVRNIEIGRSQPPVTPLLLPSKRMGLPKGPAASPLVISYGVPS